MRLYGRLKLENYRVCVPQCCKVKTVLKGYKYMIHELLRAGGLRNGGKQHLNKRPAAETKLNFLFRPFFGAVNDLPNEQYM